MSRRTERVLVTGAAGMLGSQLLRTAPTYVDLCATDLRPGPDIEAPSVELSDEEQVGRLWEERGPFAGVVHTAAYTAVDKAEEEEDLARRANAEVCGVLARACARTGARLVAVGTDFVFDGRSHRPYVESDPPEPLGAYGRTKLEGERAALREHPEGTCIVRTQWLYGPRGKHFPGTIVRLAREKGELKVVADQVGSPTTTLELAPALWDVLERGATGIYHAACEGSCSWHELARATLELAGLSQVNVVPCTTAEFPRPARRPAYSVLDCRKLSGLRGRSLAHWRHALEAYLALDPQ